MNKVRLKDIADVISEREENPAKSSYTKFVGLEHYDSGCLEIIRCGETNNLTSAMKIFKTGDTLVARRNVYLRRAGFVNFDGLTSGDSIVIRAKDKEHERLIPIILNTEHFWSYAVKHAAGSMSKRLQQNDLMDYEFELPSIEKQKELIDILWAAEEIKKVGLNALETLNTYTDILRDIYFPQNSDNVIELGQCVQEIIGGGTPSRKNESNFVGDIPWITVKDIGENDMFISDSLEHINESAIKNSATNLIKENSLIVATRISLDRAVINTRSVTINQDLKALYLKENYNIRFMYHWYKSQYTTILTFAAGTTVLGIRLEKLKALKVNNYPIDEQIKIANIFDGIESLRKMILKNIEKSGNISKFLLNGGQVDVQ